MPSRLIGLSSLEGDNDHRRDLDPFARAKHGRYFENSVVYHVVSRTRGNLFLLRPDLEGTLRAVTAGVLASAKQRFPNVSNFGSAFLSNHNHDLLGALFGDPTHIVDYIAYCKRELSRRWRELVGWNGSLWEGYRSTAVVTPEAQINALRYVVGQGVKEGLVADPRDWPGFHCAESLVSGEPIEGVWFDGTGYGKAYHAEKAKKQPKVVRREDYLERRTFSFDPLPALAHLSAEEYREHMRELVEEVVEEGRRERERRDEAVLGPEKVCAMSPMESRPVPTPPWFEERRRMVVWDNPKAPEVKKYLERYWDHQTRFRTAARRWQRGEGNKDASEFPEVCFIPGFRRRPISHMEQSTG